MACHGELVRLKPDPSHLTAFYLMIAVGGALGGVFVTVLAPQVFNRFLEVHLGALAAFVLLLLGLFVNPDSALHGGRRMGRWALLGVAFIAVGVGLFNHAAEESSKHRDATRNFYGIQWVDAIRTGDPNQDRDILVHGEIQHGSQYVAPEMRCRPTSYFAPMSGVGLAIRFFPRQDLRVGVVGLGVGVLAAYAGPDDSLRFYEINPAVERVARERFSFITECGRNVEVVLGDARLSLEQETSQHFDILVLDAFRGDALPLHLLTVEAFETYMRHLEPDGVIAAHISSIHFNLKPVFWKMADHFGLQSLVLVLPDEGAVLESGFYDIKSHWMLMTNNAQLLDALPKPPPGRLDPGQRAQLLVDPMKGVAYVVLPAKGDDLSVRLWSDDYSNPFQMLKWGAD
jgi:hypothetical protein